MTLCQSEMLVVLQKGNFGNFQNTEDSEGPKEIENFRNFLQVTVVFVEFPENLNQNCDLILRLKLHFYYVYFSFL